MTVETFRPDATLLRARGPAQERLQEEARALTRARFGRRVFVRAVVEVSNYCRENCSYCGMRRANRSLQRFRADRRALEELLLRHCPPSVTDLNIQAGEDPVAVREIVLPLLQTLRRETRLGLSVCLGTLAPELYDELRQAGARIYILKFEIADATRYQTLEGPGTLAERLAHIHQLAQAGWHVSSGFIAGLPGQTEADILDNLNLAASLPLAGCSVSPFVPGESTPLAGAASGSSDLALNAMALMRIVRPDWVIPAVSALNLVEPDNGYRRGLRLGANLVTINLTPADMRTDYLLYRRDRVIMTEERILAAIDAEALEPSSQSLAGFWEETSGQPRRLAASPTLPATQP